MPYSPVMSDSPKLTEKHPLWLRATHWANVPLLAGMIWSGVLIYWANRVYTPFIPGSFYVALGLDHRLAEGMSAHFSIAWLFALNGFIYLVGLGISRHWRELKPDRASLKELPRTLLHEIGLSKTKPRSLGKFNAAQRIAYSGALILLTLELLSGIAIYKPVQLSPLASLFGGYEGARLVHFIGMAAISLFVLVHVLQVARAGWDAFRSMVAGFSMRDEGRDL